MQDGLELPGTFGLDPARSASSRRTASAFLVDGAGEDDERAAEAAVEALAVRARTTSPSPSRRAADAVHARRARARAKAAGARLVAIVCRTGSPLAALADAAVVFDVGAEAVEGSTRLAAGTAQKAALGVLSTLAAAELGWVHRRTDGQRQARQRQAARARARTSSRAWRAVGEAAASAALAEAQNDVPVAIVVGRRPARRDAGAALVADCGGDLSRVLARLEARESERHFEARA